MSAKRSNKDIVIGVKQTMRMIELGKISDVYVAEDADYFVTRVIIDAAMAADIPIISVESKKELGRMCGIEVAASTAGILV